VFDGVSPSGADDGNGTCSTIYCHGDGQGNGSETDSANGLACTACHPDSSSGENALDGMSGEHKKHVWEENAPCSDCHVTVVENGQTITGAARHVNGTPNVSMDPTTGLTYNAGRCTGRCHGDGHTNDPW
jgi:predicted CxxxxCH...CXXCH cytochrome family protein